MTDRELMQQALDVLIDGDIEWQERSTTRKVVLKIIAALRERLARQEQSPLDRMAENARELGLDYEPGQEPGDWMVFNTGAEVASGLSYAEAVAYLTPARLERGWSASCVIDHDNPPSTSPSAPHSADSADTFCNEPVGEIVPAFAGLTAVSIPVMPPVGTKLYTSPQRREWVGLTDEEVGTLTVFPGLFDVETPLLADFIRHIEAKLKERNT